MKIILPGIPVPQARMRHSTRNGFTATYDPKAKEKKLIRKMLEISRVVHSFAFPRISFLFQMPIPKGIRKRDIELYNSGLLKHDKKPDVDNLIKLYLDCLDGIILDGDQKVSLGPCVKVYHPEPKTIIWIQETTQQLKSWEMDIAALDDEEREKQCSCAMDFLRDSCIPVTADLLLSHHNFGLARAIPPLTSLARLLSFQGLVDKASHESDTFLGVSEALLGQ